METEENKNAKTIILKQGEGYDQLQMSVIVTQEEYDKMEEVRKQNPLAWVGKEFDLLKEAKDLIAVDKEHSLMKNKRKKIIIWSAILIIVIFILLWFLPIIKMSFITWGGEMKSIPQGEMREEAGATFFLPSNWSYTIDTGALYISISMKSTTEPLFFDIRWEPPIFSRNAQSGEDDARIFVEASKGLYRTTNVSLLQFNGCEGYKFSAILKEDNQKYYRGFLAYKINRGTEDERIIIMDKVGPSINSLNSDVIKQIENTFEYKKPKVKLKYLYK